MPMGRPVRVKPQGTEIDMDVSDKSSKRRMQLSEVGLYTVKDGMVVREEFLPYTASKK